MTKRHRRRLYHFTCVDHGYTTIGLRGLLRPQDKPTLLGVALPFSLVWLTTGDFYSTGMDQSGAGLCDRSEYRYIVTDTTHCERWYDSARRAEFFDFAQMLESVGDPSQWWVSAEPVPVRLG